MCPHESGSTGSRSTPHRRAGPPKQSYWEGVERSCKAVVSGSFLLATSLQLLTVDHCEEGLPVSW